MHRKWARLAVVPALAGTLSGAVATEPIAAVTRSAVATVGTGGPPLNVRTGPSTINALVTRLANGTRISAICQEYGQLVAGTQRTTAFWHRLAPGRYVSDGFVRWTPTRGRMHWCVPTGATNPVVRNPSGPVNVRSGPGARFRRVGRLPSGSVLVANCQAWGEPVTGSVRRSSAWIRLGKGRYISDAYVSWVPSRPWILPWCGQAPPTVPATTSAQFMARIAPGARAGYRRYRVPASVTMAQAILESGWGRSGLTRRDHAYFGIKCFGGPGAIAIGCRSYPTHECGRNGCYLTRASFRAYRSATGSLTDHGHFLATVSRYRQAFRYSRDPNRFAIEIHKAGYATSPRYATNLINLMRQYNLYRYDRP